jgi:hypothetical protein
MTLDAIDRIRSRALAGFSNKSTDSESDILTVMRVLLERPLTKDSYVSSKFGIAAALPLSGPIFHTSSAGAQARIARDHNYLGTLKSPHLPPSSQANSAITASWCHPRRLSSSRSQFWRENLCNESNVTPGIRCLGSAQSTRIPSTPTFILSLAARTNTALRSSSAASTFPHR